MWASLSHSSSFSKVRSVHWWYITQTYQKTLIDIITLLNPEGADWDELFLGIGIATTVLPGTKNTQSPLLTATALAQQTRSDAVEEEGELLLLAPHYLAVAPCYILHDS